MKIRTRIILASMVVIIIMTILFSYYFINKERNLATQQLYSTIDKDSTLLKALMARPLYDGDVNQLRQNIVSIFSNENILYISLTENNGDIRMVESRPSPNPFGTEITSEIKITRGIDELGSLEVIYTTALIEERLAKSRDELIIFSFLLTLLISIVILVIARGLTTPIENLTTAARNMADGDLEQKITVMGAEELMVLGDSFIKLRDAINEKITDLAEKNAQLSQEIANHNRTQQALVESEQKYRTFFEKSSSPMLMIQGNRFIDCNQAARDILKLDPDININTLSIEAISPEYQPDGTLSQELITKRRNALTEIGASASFETYHQRPNGEIFPVAVNATVISTDGGALRHVIWTDISSRKQAELELAKYRHHLEDLVKIRTRELESVNRELEAFSYSVSHDLRAPLRSIDGFSQALIEDCSGNLGEAGIDYLNRVRKNAQHMARLIDSMLQLSRLTRAELDVKHVNLSELVMDIFHKLQEDNPDHRVEIQVDQDMMIKGDRGLIRVLMENLLSNAWKYSAKNPAPRIEVGSYQEDGESVYFVRDNGAGFDMRYVSKLFGAFQRLHSPDEFQGTGIGLATVQRVIARHHGRVWGEGKVGEGATFYFSLQSNTSHAHAAGGNHVEEYNQARTA